jgi:hypothetical protein
MRERRCPTDILMMCWKSRFGQVLAVGWWAFGGMIAPNALDYVVIGAQAAAVALLAELEYFGLRKTLVVAHSVDGSTAPARQCDAFDHPAPVPTLGSGVRGGT